MADERRDDDGLVIGPGADGGDVESVPRAWTPGPVRNDREIADDVRRRLGEHASLDARAVSVRVQQGRVTLEGTVSDPPARHVAELIADAVPGVRDVVNRLATAR
jgi:osmotically-inducible protein OsmY